MNYRESIVYAAPLDGEKGGAFLDRVLGPTVMDCPELPESPGRPSDVPVGRVAVFPSMALELVMAGSPGEAQPRAVLAYRGAYGEPHAIVMHLEQVLATIEGLQSIVNVLGDTLSTRARRTVQSELPATVVGDSGGMAPIDGE